MVRKIRGWTDDVRTLRDFTVHDWGRYLREGMPKGQTLEGVERKGKMIVFTLSQGTLVCHNAMSGFWDVADEPWTFDYVEGRRRAQHRDVRVTMFLENGDSSQTRALRFHDARKFGSLRFYTTKDWLAIPPLAAIGPDALSVKLEQFRENMRRGARSRRPIKEVLMDQAVVSGVGNIYAAEALWYARVRPDRPVRLVNDREMFKVWLCMRCVLLMALKRNLDYSGLRVYRRKTCVTCQGQIQKIDMKGRSTYLCEGCQR